MDEFTSPESMLQISTEPAIFQQINYERGDLFAAIASDACYVVRAENSVPNGDLAAKKFVAGWIGFDNIGIPSYMALLQRDHLTPCVPIGCLAVCPKCWGSMEPREGTFICTYDDCKHRM